MQDSSFLDGCTRSAEAKYLASTKGEDESNAVGSAEQPSVAPAADATDMTAAATASEPVLQVDGVDELSTPGKPLEPMVDLSVYRTDTSQEDLDEEAVVLMQTIRETILNTNTLLISLTTKPGVFNPFENEVAILDATTSYLISILGPSAAAQATPTREQRLRRFDIQKRHDEVVKRLVRLPVREREDEVAREPQPEEVAAPSPEQSAPRSEPVDYKGSLSLADRSKQLVAGGETAMAGPGSSELKMRMIRRLKMEQQSRITREAQRGEVARPPAEVSEPFDLASSSASLNEYLKRFVRSGGISRGGSGSGHQEQAEPTQKAELEVDDSGLDGVGWLYEVD